MIEDKIKTFEEYNKIELKSNEWIMLIN
jgi:hypothetical protein